MWRQVEPTHKLIEIWMQVSKKHNYKANIPVSEQSMFLALADYRPLQPPISLEKQQPSLVHCTRILYRTKASAGTPIYLSYV